MGRRHRRRAPPPASGGEREGRISTVGAHPRPGASSPPPWDKPASEREQPPPPPSARMKAVGPTKPGWMLGRAGGPRARGTHGRARQT
jgi:hypothetical protein